MLKLRDADTGESELECYTVPEGKCVTLAIFGEPDYRSIILTLDMAAQLATELRAP